MIFSEGSGVNDSIYGKVQAPIRKYLESREEAYEKKSLLMEIFGEQKSNNWAEGYTGLTGFAGFKPVGENGAYPQEEVKEQDVKVIENMTWKDSFAISREMIDDNKSGAFKSQPEGFVKGYYRTRERHGAAMLAGAMSGLSRVQFDGWRFDATCCDGLPLFHTQHPSKVKKTLKQSNCFANTLTAADLGKVESAMQNFKGENGELLGIAPTTIVIPNDAALKKAAFEAVGSVDDPSTSNNAFNYQYGRWNILVWPYLNEFLASGAAPWMLLDKEHSDLVGSLIWQTRVELEVTSEKAGNDANVWKGYARFVAGFNDWRGVAVGGISGGDNL